MKRIGFVFIALLLYQNIIHAALFRQKRVRRSFQHHLYIVPHTSYGGIYQHDKLQVAGSFSAPVLFGWHWQISRQLACAFMWHEWLDYENDNYHRLYFNAYDVVAKYRSYWFKLPLLSQPVQLYVQGGLNYISSGVTKGKGATALKGSGVVLGLGAHYSMQRLFLDLSYKRLQPVWHRDIAGVNLWTLGTGVQLI